jgi:hypothetical protein
LCPDLRGRPEKLLPIRQVKCRGLVAAFQLCETMIRMSRTQSFLILAIGWLGMAGCCGGGTGGAHKCDFSPPGSHQDGGTDAGLRCPATCDPTQVCCVTKVPAGVGCVDPKDFIAKNCEKPELSCIVPADCPGGTVCCLSLLTGLEGIACLPPQVCPGDGVSTYRVCAMNSDCPTPLSHPCQAADFVSDSDGGALNLCL